MKRQKKKKGQKSPPNQHTPEIDSKSENGVVEVTQAEEIVRNIEDTPSLDDTKTQENNHPDLEEECKIEKEVKSTDDLEEEDANSDKKEAIKAEDDDAKEEEEQDEEKEEEEDLVGFIHTRVPRSKTEKKKKKIPAREPQVVSKYLRPPPVRRSNNLSPQMLACRFYISPGGTFDPFLHPCFLLSLSLFGVNK